MSTPLTNSVGLSLYECHHIPICVGCVSYSIPFWTKKGLFMTQTSQISDSTTDSSRAADQLWRWSATDMASAVATGVVSSREIVESCLERIDEVNPYLNALVEVRPEEALSLADEADRRRSAGEELGPLHGVPVSIKINSDQAGYATTQGVVAFKDAVADEDSPHVASLRRAGAVIMGRSNSPAFAYRWFTNNDLHGRTLNPWDADYTRAVPVAGPAPRWRQAWCRWPAATTSADRCATRPMPAA